MRKISHSEDPLVSEIGIIVEDVVVEIEGSSSDVVRKGSVDSLSSKKDPATKTAPITAVRSIHFAAPRVFVFLACSAFLVP